MEADWAYSNWMRYSREWWPSVSPPGLRYWWHAQAFQRHHEWYSATEFDFRVHECKNVWVGLTNDNPRSISRQMTMGTSESGNMEYCLVKWFQRIAFANHLQINRIIDGQPLPASPPVSTMTHCNGSTRMPYFIRFSSNNLKPPIVNSRKPQLTRPVKSWKPELHENSESLGRWHLQNENENNANE